MQFDVASFCLFNFFPLYWTEINPQQCFGVVMGNYIFLQTIARFSKEILEPMGHLSTSVLL